MASPSRATLLFPREIPPEIPDRPSERRLDSVGALAVLGAMVEQRRQSQPPPAPESEEEDVTQSQERRIIDKKSLGFIKIR